MVCKYCKPSNKNRGAGRSVVVPSNLDLAITYSSRCFRSFAQMDFSRGVRPSPTTRSVARGGVHSCILNPRLDLLGQQPPLLKGDTSPWKWPDTIHTLVIPLLWGGGGEMKAAFVVFANFCGVNISPESNSKFPC